MMQQTQQMGAQEQQKPGTKPAPQQQGQSAGTPQQGVNFTDWAAI